MPRSKRGIGPGKRGHGGMHGGDATSSRQCAACPVSDKAGIGQRPATAITSPSDYGTGERESSVEARWLGHGELKLGGTMVAVVMAHSP